MPKTNKNTLMSTISNVRCCIFTALYIFVLFSQSAIATSVFKSDFDHFTTGFPLIGSHEYVNCEVCHVNGVFRGTPKVCNECHDGVTAIGKSAKHVPTSAQCDGCHTVDENFKDNANMDHSIPKEACSACHDNHSAIGKNTNHIPTNNRCEVCHNSNTFKPVDRVDHNNVIGTCKQCHNGTLAPGQDNDHMITDLECSVCHNVGAWIPLENFDHTTITNESCKDCHAGIMLTDHIPTNADCVVCHNFQIGWKGVTFNHATITTQLCSGCHAKLPAHIATNTECEVCHIPDNQWQLITPFDHNNLRTENCDACHNNTIASGKSETHMVTVLDCSTCHTDHTDFGLFNFTHPIRSDNCIECHNGINAAGRGVNHIALNNQNRCEACHTTAGWEVLSSNVDHNLVTGTCDSANCHTRPDQHPGTTNQCDACHSPDTAWKPLSAQMMNHGQIQTACSTCHNVAHLDITSKPTNHIQSTDDCDACHITTSWTEVVINHSYVDTSSCAASGCHDGLSANITGKHAAHVDTSNECGFCHTTTPPWNSINIDHSHIGPTAQCVDCHNGTNAMGKGANHIGSSDSCDSCHGTDAGWTTVSVDHAALIPAAQGICTTCHFNGGPGGGMDADHVTVETFNNCDDCHMTSAWIPTQFDHSLVNTANCAISGCHDGSSSAAGKGADHIGTDNACEACHAPGTSAYWTPTVVDHTHIIAVTPCVQCHNTTVAIGKPQTHISTSDNCDSCHQAIVGGWTGTSIVVDHDQVLGSCQECHQQLAAHPMTGNDCNACHVPLAWKPIPAAQMDHSQIRSNCAVCHNAAFADISNKSATHFNTTDECDACHNIPPAVWTQVVVDHDKILTSSCLACHNGTDAPGQGQNHFVTFTGVECSLCHATNVAWMAGITMNHSGVDTSQCTVCHDGVRAAGQGGNHVSTLPTSDCGLCHSTDLGWTNGITMNHDALTDSSLCTACHVTGGIGSVYGANHIPVPAATDCDVCHTTNGWVPTDYDHAQYQLQGGILIPCTACHNGTQGRDRPVTHIDSSELCQACHTPDAGGWNDPNLVVDHNEVRGNCVTCHTQTATHPGTSNDCQACHTTQTWRPVTAQTMNHEHIRSACVNCHNNTIAIGKGAGHLVTTDVCDACHGLPPTLWTEGVVDHSSIDTSSCIVCHNGTDATGKPGTHITTLPNTECFVCHAINTGWRLGMTMNHNGVNTASCLACHNGSIATGMGGNHVPIQATVDCQVCHSVEGWTVGIVVNHDALPNNVRCDSCHVQGGAGPAPSTNHIPIPAQSDCNECHETGAWTPTNYDHAAYEQGGGILTPCTNCHNGTLAVAKPATHIPTDTICDACHIPDAVIGWSDPNMVVDHTHVNPVTCITCHNTLAAAGKHVAHVLTSDNCDRCHQPNSNGWNDPNMVVDHNEVLGSCSDCHSQTPTHPGTTNDCGACHAPENPWITDPMSTMDHVQIRSQCALCHNNVIGTGKPGTHIATNDLCDACHEVPPAPWTQVVVDHNQINTSSCVVCHNGTDAQGQGTNHITTLAQVGCDVCHATNTDWMSGMTMDHNGVNISSCITCHNGSIAMGKGATHVITQSNAECNLCHSVDLGWTGGITMDHSALTNSTVCNSCHVDGGIGVGIGVNHIPIAQADCDLCHRVEGWVPTDYDHAAYQQQGGVLIPCTSCHNGVQASAKSATHITTSDRCDACHIPDAVIGWQDPNMVVDHAEVRGSCNSCHTQPPTHPGTSNQCDLCHDVSPPWNQLATFDHAAATGACIDCHRTAGFALGKPNTHYLTTDVCGDCHNTNAFVEIQNNFSHTASREPLCVTCHQVGQAGIGKPVTHVPASERCDACHNTDAFIPYQAVDHNELSGNISACNSCHAPGGIATAPGSRHFSYSGFNCDECHTTNGWVPAIRIAGHRFANASQAVGDHRVFSMEDCNACHNNAVNSLVKGYDNGYPRTCAGCHALDYRSNGNHNSGGVSQNTNCGAGGCHRVSGSGF